jgi:phosphoribosylanthranilate isomerase
VSRNLGNAAPVTPLVKVCGITSEPDGRAALAAGAGLLGFILAASPRQVTAAKAARLVAALRRAPGGRPALMVGVFKDAPAAAVFRAARRARFDLVQLHGSETPADVGSLSRRGLLVMKVVRRLGRAAAAEMRRYPEAFAFLLEKPVPRSWRGTARTADWRKARPAIAAHPRVGIAGNLSPDNVRRAVREAERGLWLVDAASTLERSPGRKDGALVRRFVKAARG